MTYEVFGSTYTFLTPERLWLLAFLPLLWLPVFWQRQRLVITSAALLHSLAAVLIIAALAGLSTQTILAEHRLALVAAADVSDSISPEGKAWTHEYLTRLIKTLEPEDEFAALSFAADTDLLIPPGAPNGVTLPNEALKTARAGRR